MRFATMTAAVSFCGALSAGCLSITSNGRQLDAGDSGVDSGPVWDGDSGPMTEPDSGPRDSGVTDAGQPDSGPPDSGVPDSGVPDSGVPDSGQPDSGLFGCVIDGQFYSSRALNPTNLGECCNPRTSPNAWLPLLHAGASVTPNGGPNDGAVGDFNGDGFPDVAIATSTPQSVYAYLGLPDGGGYAQPFVYAAGAWPIDVAVGDMNRDGLDDLVVASGALLGGTPSIAVLISRGDGTFNDPQVIQAACSVGQVCVGDINHDGWNDVITNACGSQVFANMGSGNGQLSQPYDLGMSGRQIQVLNLNGDIVTTNGALSVAINDGDGGFPTVTTTQLSGAYGFAVAAFSKGAGQVAVETGSTLSLVSINPGSGAGTVLSTSAIDTAGQRAVAADLNGDGFPDVISFSSSALGVSINLTDGGFADAVDISVPPQAYGVQMIYAGDLNGDGAADILVMIGNGPWIQYLNSCP